MKRRKLPVVVATALCAGALTAIIPPLDASARGSGRSGGLGAVIARKHHHHPPLPYKPEQPTAAAPDSSWVASYRGASNWSVIDLRSSPGASLGSYNESSQVEYNYQPGNVQMASAFDVPYPTPCIEFRSAHLACPFGNGIPVGNGKESGSFKIADTLQTTGQPKQSISCSGHGSAKGAIGSISVTTEYVRAPDAYRITLDGAQFQQFQDPQCPTPNAMMNPLGDWFATDAPGPGSADYWTSAGVEVPAKVFAHSKVIVIVLRLLAKHSPGNKKNCGLGPQPQSDGSTEKCTIDAEWTGTLTLHRLNSRGQL